VSLWPYLHLLDTYVSNTPALDAFVCDKCDSVIDELPPWILHHRYRKEEFEKKDHHLYHNLIRFYGSELMELSPPELHSEKEAANGKLSTLVQERLERIENAMEVSAGRIGGMEDRLGNIERLLGLLLSGQALGTKIAAANGLSTDRQSVIDLPMSLSAESPVEGKRILTAEMTQVKGLINLSGTIHHLTSIWFGVNVSSLLEA
jgi:hypothetical protein